MTQRTSPWPKGTPSWTDLAVDDVEVATAFYAAVLGWEYDDAMPEGDYRMATVNGLHVAAIWKKPSPEMPDFWLLYLSHPDVDAAASDIGEHGGRVWNPPEDVGDYGRMCIAADPTGAPFAVWQAKEHIGFQYCNGVGGVTWEDLRSTDPSASQDFYSKVFGVHMEAVEMAPGDYRTFHLEGDEAPLGGMGGFMGAEEASSYWLVYFGVANTDAALVAAEKAGGRVTMPAFDSPYGRMGGITDPNGATFVVIQTNPDQPQPNRDG